MLPRDSIPQPDASGFDFRALAEVISAAPGERPPPASGTALRYVGDYLLEQEIARGGMGVVYRARQLTLDRVVAVKVLRDSALAGGTEVERFRREASAAAALHHRNIIGIHEIGDHEGMCFFSMDYVPGPTLGELVKDSPLPARKAAALMVKIASAIQHAHAAGVLHRDIKPSNVIMDAAGEPVVMDFGLARHDAAALDLTFSGQVLGTPAYMAPEVAQGKSRAAGAASDVYGLGALLYHMLTGRAPFAGESHLAVLQQVLSDEPVSAALLNPALPGDLVNICAKAMSREAARRYDSAGALEADLQRFLDGRPVLARPVTPLGRLWRWSRRHRALAAALTSVFLLSVAVAVISAVAAGRLKSARDSEAAARSRAEENAWQTELNLYASDTATAWRNYDDGALAAMKQRLQDHLPQPGGRDPRGFEWHLLERFSGGEQTRTLTLPGSAQDAALTPGGEWLVVAGGGEARLIEAASGREAAMWPEGESPRVYRHLALQHGSSLLASASVHGVRSIDAATGSVRRIQEEPAGAVAFSPDGAHLAVANQVAARTEDGRHRVRLYRTADWQVAREWPLHCRGLAWNSAGQLIVCDTPAGIPGRFSWFDPAKDEPVRQFALNPGRSPVQLAILNPGVDRFFLQLGNQEDCYGTLSTGNILLRRAGATMQQSAMTQDAHEMVFTGEDTALRLWDLISGRDGPVRRGHTGRVLAVAFTRDAKGLRSVSADGTLRDWDLRSDWQAPVGKCYGATAQTGWPVISPDGKTAALPAGISATGQDDALLLYDVAARKPLTRLYAAPMAWSPDGQWLLAMRAASVLAIHIPSLTEHIISRLPEPPAAWLPRVSADWKWIAWTADGKSVRITPLTGGQQLAVVPAADGAPAFSPDARQLAIPRQEGTVIVALDTGALRPAGLAAATLAAWSQDGTLLATASGTSVTVHDAATGQKRKDFSGHRGLVCSLAWAPDGRSLAVGCEDSTIHFWNLATGRDAFALPFHTRPFLMAFARDGSALIAGGTRGYRMLETALRLPVEAPLPIAFTLPDPSAGSPAARPAPAPEPSTDRAVINQRLLNLWEAAQVYRQQRGAWPDHLSALRDLLPEPMDRALMHPEAERTGRFFWQDDYTDPACPSPFHYEWCTVLCAAEGRYKDMSWKTDGPLTQREYSEHARKLYGDKVPFIRCFVMHEEGELPAILYDGTLALLPDDWEKAYKTGWRPAPQKP